MSKYPYKTVNIDTTRTLRNTLNSNFKDIESDFKEVKKDFDNAVEIVSDRAFNKVVDAAKIEWLPPVNTYSDLAKTYPNVSEGKTVMTRDSGKVYRYNGTSWVEIQDIDPTVINEVDRRLTAQLAQTIHQIGEFPINVAYFEKGLLNEIYERGINIKWFGAKGDYISPSNRGTDNTQFIQNAINYALENDVTLYVPNESFYVGSAIDLGLVNKNSIKLLLKGNGTNSAIIFGGTQLFRLENLQKTFNYSEFDDLRIESMSGLTNATAFFIRANYFAYNKFRNVEIRNCTSFDLNANGWLNRWDKCMLLSTIGTPQFRLSKDPNKEIAYFSANSIVGSTLYSSASKIIVGELVELDVFNLIDTVIEGNGTGFSFDGGSSIINFENCYLDGTTSVFKSTFSKISADITLNFTNTRMWQTNLSDTFINAYSDHFIHLNINNCKFTGEPKDGSFYVSNYGTTILNGSGNTFEKPNKALRSKSGVELSKIKRFDGLENNTYIKDGEHWFPPLAAPPSTGYQTGSKVPNANKTLANGNVVDRWERVSDGWLEIKSPAGYYIA